MSKIQILIEFKTALVDFFDELIEQFPDEGDLVMVRIFINDQVPIADVMSVFITRLLPLKEIVGKRDVNFFLGPAASSLFEKIDKSKVNYFKILWQSDRLDESDRLQIWKWYDYFIIISEKYQKAVV
jgi:hypothetical protein